MAGSSSGQALVSDTSGSRFLHSILTLASGSTLAQVITLAAMPFITRLYDPAAFGAFSVFVAITTLLISVSSLQFAEVVVIARSPQEADQALFIGALISLVLSTLTALLLWLTAGPIAYYLGFPEQEMLLHLVALVVLLGGLRQVLRRWLLREHRPGRIAASEVGMALSDRVATLGVALPLGGSPLGLVLGRVAGFVVSVLLVLRPRDCRPFSRAPGLYTPRELAGVLRRYRHFVIHSWGVLLDTLSQQLPVLMVSALLGPAVAGGFALARRVLAEPAIVLGAALAQSYYQHAAREEDPRALAEVTTAMTAILVKAVALPVIIALVCAPALFPILFGGAWQETGWYTLILAPQFMVYFVMRPLNRIFDITERQREKGGFALQNILVTLLTLGVAAIYDNAYAILAIFSLAGTVFLVYRAAWLLTLVQVDLAALARDLLPAVLCTVLVCGLQYWLRLAVGPDALVICLGSIAACLVYAAIIVVPDRRIRQFIQDRRARRGRGT